MKIDKLGFVNMVDVVPEQKIGSASVKHFTITEPEARFNNMRAAMHGGRREDEVEPGRFARLMVSGGLMMSDTHGERWSNWVACRDAKGDVLIAGLGLGMLAVAMSLKESVRSITIVENNSDVIALVGPHIASEKITVVHGDIFTWLPGRGQKWDCIWFDIWPHVCTDNLKQIAQLHQKFKARKRLWMRSWRHDDLLHRRRAGR